MTITQTVKVPINRRLIIDVPREIPTESVIITFTPAKTLNESSSEPQLERSLQNSSTEKSEARDIELFKLHADRLNAEALDVLSYQDIDL